MGWLFGSVCEAFDTQAWQLEFDPHSPHKGRRREPALQLASNLYMCAPPTTTCIIQNNVLFLKNISCLYIYAQPKINSYVENSKENSWHTFKLQSSLNLFLYCLAMYNMKYNCPACSLVLLIKISALLCVLEKYLICDFSQVLHLSE